MAWDERRAVDYRARMELERKRAMRRAVDQLRSLFEAPPPGGQLVLMEVALHEPRQLMLPLGAAT